MNRILPFIFVLSVCAFARAEKVRFATYNIERWAERFDTKQVRDFVKTLPKSDELKALVDQHVIANNKGNWVAATVIQAVDPDIMVFEEGCNQADLDAFNEKYLRGAYETHIVFPNNSGRDQNTGLIAKPGFKVLKVMADYYKEKDTVPKDWLKGNPDEDKVTAENRLFARGPAFVLMQSPGGKQFWIGVNHQKSKSGNSPDVAKWRAREATRLHGIIKELEKTGPADVVFGGDMNDEFGLQEFEQAGGGDSISLIQGPPQDGIVLATKPLIEKGDISFGGYDSPMFRSLIDHFFVTKSLKDKIVDIHTYKDGVAPAASDHYPLVMEIDF